LPTEFQQKQKVVKLENRDYKPTHRRIFSDKTLRALRLLKSPTTDQFESQEALFSEMSQGTIPPFDPNVGTTPYDRSQPAAYQTQSTPASLRPPQQTGSFMDTTLTNVDAAGLSKLIMRYHDQFDASSFIEGIKYQGFNRDEFIRNALTKISPSLMIRLALLGSIRGANFEKIVKSASSMDADIIEANQRNLVVRRARKSEDITILRCSAAIPQWTAYYMGISGVSKKFGNLALPASLQFPAAGSMPMSAQVRAMHVEFSVHFSRVIGGDFNENIYMAMVNNMIPLSEIPDQVKIQLGVSDDAEARQVDVQAIIASVFR